MYQSFKQLCVAMACIASIGATTASLAAQPAPGTGANAPRSMPSGPGPIQVAAPGTLQSMQGTASVELGTPTSFSFAGSGHCRLTLDSGDGFSSTFEGELPFTRTYTYSSTTMTSYETYKDYQASVSTHGNCKAAGPGPFKVTVRITNSHAQSLSGPSIGNNTVSASNAAKLGLSGITTAASAPLPSASIPASGVRVLGK